VLKGYVRKAVDRGIASLKRATELEVVQASISGLDGPEDLGNKEFQS
jgi:hypothetical protein